MYDGINVTYILQEDTLPFIPRVYRTLRYAIASAHPVSLSDRGNYSRACKITLATATWTPLRVMTQFETVDSGVRVTTCTEDDLNSHARRLTDKVYVA